MKKMLDVLQPEIEKQFKSLNLCISKSENAVPGELLSEVTVTLRTKFRNYMQAAVEKLAGNVSLFKRFSVFYFRVYCLFYIIIALWVLININS